MLNLAEIKNYTDNYDVKTYVVGDVSSVSVIDKKTGQLVRDEMTILKVQAAYLIYNEAKEAYVQDYKQFGKTNTDFTQYVTKTMEKFSCNGEVNNYGVNKLINAILRNNGHYEEFLSGGNLGESKFSIFTGSKKAYALAFLKLKFRERGLDISDIRISQDNSRLTQDGISKVILDYDAKIYRHATVIDPFSITRRPENKENEMYIANHIKEIDPQVYKTEFKAQIQSLKEMQKESQELFSKPVTAEIIQMMEAKASLYVQSCKAVADKMRQYFAEKQKNNNQGAVVTIASKVDLLPLEDPDILAAEEYIKTHQVAFGLNVKMEDQRGNSLFEGEYKDDLLLYYNDVILSQGKPISYIKNRILEIASEPVPKDKYQLNDSIELIEKYVSLYTQICKIYEKEIRQYLAESYIRSNADTTAIIPQMVSETGENLFVGMYRNDLLALYKTYIQKNMTLSDIDQMCFEARYGDNIRNARIHESLHDQLHAKALEEAIKNNSYDAAKKESQTSAPDILDVTPPAPAENSQNVFDNQEYTAAEKFIFDNIGVLPSSLVPMVTSTGENLFKGENRDNLLLLYNNYKQRNLSLDVIRYDLLATKKQNPRPDDRTRNYIDSLTQLYDQLCQETIKEIKKQNNLANANDVRRQAIEVIDENAKNMVLQPMVSETGENLFQGPNKDELLRLYEERRKKGLNLVSLEMELSSKFGIIDEKTLMLLIEMVNQLSEKLIADKMQTINNFQDPNNDPKYDIEYITNKLKEAKETKDPVQIASWQKLLEEAQKERQTSQPQIPNTPSGYKYNVEEVEKYLKAAEETKDSAQINYWQMVMGEALKERQAPQPQDQGINFAATNIIQMMSEKPLTVTDEQWASMDNEQRRDFMIIKMREALILNNIPDYQKWSEEVQKLNAEMQNDQKQGR